MVPDGDRDRDGVYREGSDASFTPEVLLMTNSGRVNANVVSVTVDGDLEVPVCTDSAFAVLPPGEVAAIPLPYPLSVAPRTLTALLTDGSTHEIDVVVSDAVSMRLYEHREDFESACG